MAQFDNGNMSQWLTLFGQNIAMGFVVVAIFAAFWATLEGRWRRAEPVVVGVLFGCAGIVSMLRPVHIADGIILDMRNVFVLMGGLFGGPLGATIATGITGLYRLYIGGVGTLSGVGGIVTAGLVGALIAQRYGARVREFGLLQLTTVGLIDALATIAWTRVLFAIKDLPPLPVAAEASVLLIYPAATGLLGIAMSMTHYRMWRRSHRRLADILEISNELVWEQDVAGRMVYASERYAEIFGMPVSEIVGKTPEQLGWTPVDAATARAYHAAFSTHLPFREMSFVQPTKSGVLKLISVTGRPILDGRGRFFGYRGTATDITEREKLRSLVATISGQVGNIVGENFLKTLVQSVRDVLDVDLAHVGRFDLAAGTLSELYISAKDRFITSNRFAYKGLPAEVIAGGLPLTAASGVFERFPRLAAIARFKIEAYAAVPLIGAKGEILGLLSVISNRPFEAPEYVETILNLFAGRAAAELERIVNEEAAELNRQRMTEVLAALDIERDAIIITNGEGAITYTNRSATEILGLPADGTALGQRLRDLTADRGFGVIAEAAAATLAIAREWHGSTPWIRPSDGKTITFEARARSVPGGGTVTVITDATERLRLEEEERRHQERLERAQRVGKIGSIEADLVAGTSVWSNELYRILGLDPSVTASFDGFLDSVHPDDRDMFRRLRANSMAGRSNEPTEFRIIRPNGEVRWLFRQGETVFDEGGKVRTLVATLLDITERKRLEENLRRSHDGLVHAQRIGNIGAVEANYVTGESIWSDELCRIMGIDRANAPRTTTKSREMFNELIHPEDRQRVNDLIAMNRQGRQTDPVDMRIVRPNGETRWLHREADIFVDSDGKALGGIATYQDVTDRHRMEEALRLGHERLERAQRVGKIGSVETDLITGEEFFSAELFEITGLDAEIGRPLLKSLLAIIHDDDRDRVSACIAANRVGVTTQPIDFRIQRPDGEWRWLYREGEPIFGTDGAPVSTMAIIQDVTERKRMEVELAAREETLHRSARHLASAQRVGRMGSVEIDLATGKSIWSAETYHLFGIDSLGGQPNDDQFMAMVHVDDREKLRDLRTKELNGVETDPSEYRLIRSDGELRWMYRLTDLVRDAEGRPTRLIVTHQDFTDREKWRRAMATLSGSVGNLIGQDFLRSLVANVAQALSANIVYIGRFDVGEESVRTQFVHIDGDFVENRTFSHRGAPSGLIAAGRTVVIAAGLTGQFPDAPNAFGIKSEAYAGTPLYGAKGNLLGLLVARSSRAWEAPDYVETVLNLFARRAAAEIERIESEEEAERSRNKMSEILAALDIARNAVVLVDDEWRVQYFNNVAVDVLGLPPKPELILGSPLQAFQSGSDYLGVAMVGRAALIATGQWQGTVPWARPNDGRKLFLDVHINRLPQGGFVEVATDATARVRFEEEERRRQERQAQASKLEALGNLAGGIAHDFNNLLGAVLGFGQFLVQDLEPGSDQHKFAERIVGVSQRGRSLVQQILTFSRRSVVEPTQVRLQDTIAETHDLLRATLPATTEIVIDDRIANATVLADRGQLVQVLVNLCSNASDALEGDPGTVTVSVAKPDRRRADFARLPLSDGKPSPTAIETWHDSDGIGHIATGAIPSGDCIALSVADTGSGISESMLGQIFEPFITTKEKGRGTGLGLAVVHRIVVEHGGAIIVTTRKGWGTRFDILLPLSADVVQAAYDHPADGPPGIAADGTATILVVDDDEAYCAMVQTALRRVGYQVQSTNDPRVALGWVRSGNQRWSVLVTDQTMPHIRGRDLVRSFKALSPETYCVICTGFSSGLNEQQAMAAGADGFMLKPFNVNELATLVARLLAHEPETPLSKV